MNPAGYAIQQRSTTLVFIVLIIAGGAAAYCSLGRLEDPEFTIKEAVIYTHYPGANAEQVELEVTEPIETAIQQLKQLKEVRSISRAGLSIVFAEIQETYDKLTLPQVWDELRRKVSAAAKELPPGCQTPSVNDDFGDVYGVLFAVTGNGYSAHDLKEIGKDLRREILLCEDVGRVDFWGMQTEVVYVEIDPMKLSQFGLDPADIIKSIQQQNTVTGTGKIAVGSEEVRLRITGDYNNVEELADQLVPGGTSGHMIRLKDIARVERGIMEPPSEVLNWNGQPAIGIGISTVSGGDVIAMGDGIEQRLEQLKGHIPVGIEIHPIAHQSKTVKEAVKGFIFNLVESVVIVMLLLFLFMGWREGLIISLVLVLIILATFVCMWVMDISLQRISLGALIIALGMLVDNAIVVTEGIVIKLKQGLSHLQAAEKTVCETQWPLLGATGIAILAFAAITLSKDMTGEWLQSLFQVICLSLGLSWIFAITVTPYLCSLLLPRVLIVRENLYQGVFFQRYRGVVSVCINHRWLSLAAVVFLLILSLWGFGYVRQDFMPDMIRPQITVDVWMPEGTHIERTMEEMASINEYIRTLEGVMSVASFVGRGPLRFLLTFEPEMPNSAYGQLLVNLESPDRIPDIRSHLIQYLNENHPRAITSVDAFKLGPGGGSVAARLCGPDAMVLRELSVQVEAIMNANHNSRSIRTDWDQPVKVQTYHLAQSRSPDIGVTRPELADALNMNFSGVIAGTYRHNEDLLPVILRPPLEYRQGIDNGRNVLVWSSMSGRWIPIEQVTDGASLQWETPVIQRLNRKRVLRVICKQIHGTTDGLFRQLKEPIESLPLPEGYTLEWGGEHEEQVEANAKLMSNVPIAFMGMFLISVMLFNTLRHPLIIFLGIPLTAIGVTCGMLLADKPFGFMAMLGFLSLSGMVIKNEIVLLDEINLEKAAGKEDYEAVLDSAVSRVRPVCMAAFTTVFGMAPLLCDAFFGPMAVTIMGGLTFATVLTLVIVPVLYSTLFRIQHDC